MYFTFARKDWVTKVTHLTGLIDKKSSLPITHMLYLEAPEAGEHASVRLTATNLEVSASFQVPANVTRPGRVCLPCQNFATLIKTIQEEEFALAAADTSIITLTTETGEYTLSGVSPDEFPILTPPTLGPSISIKASAWAAALDQVRFAVSSDESRVALTGVYLESTLSGLRCVATDGHRLAQSVPIPVSETSFPSCILPKKAVDMLSKQLWAEETVSYRPGEAQAVVEFSHGTLMSRCIDATFPVYRNVIPEPSMPPVEVARDEYIQKLQQVLLASSDTRLVRHTFQNDQLLLTAQDLLHGAEAEETLPLVAKTDIDLIIGFNGAYVLDALKAGKSATVTFAANGELDPGLFTDAATPGAAWVVMPMRV